MQVKIVARIQSDLIKWLCRYSVVHDMVRVLNEKIKDSPFGVLLSNNDWKAKHSRKTSVCVWFQGQYTKNRESKIVCV